MPKTIRKSGSSTLVTSAASCTPGVMLRNMPIQPATAVMAPSAATFYAPL